jgi:hypothetical protein
VSLAQGRWCTCARGSEVFDNSTAEKGDARCDAHATCCVPAGIVPASLLGAHLVSCGSIRGATWPWPHDQSCPYAHWIYWCLRPKDYYPYCFAAIETHAPLCAFRLETKTVQEFGSGTGRMKPSSIENIPPRYCPSPSLNNLGMSSSLADDVLCHWLLSFSFFFSFG